MVAVFDIGNTNTHIGLYKGRVLLRKLSFPTRKKLLPLSIKRIIEDNRLEGVVIVSVVPYVTKQLIKLCRVHRTAPIIVSSKLKCGLRYKYHNPATLGADRIAVVVGALSRYNRDVIVVDAGTAITIDVATRGGYHLGGIILPGMHMLAELMHRKTAQLPQVRVSKPKNLIGKSTKECIQTGIFNGTMTMIRGLIQDIKMQVRGDYYCVATGGSGKLIAQHVGEVDEYNENLCIYGALDIYYKHA